MKYRSKIPQSKPEVISVLLEMPGERGENWGKGVALSSSLGRTYTRVEGDTFQISQTAGMGGSVTGNGSLTEYDDHTAINLTFKFHGILPNGTWPALILSSIVIAPISYFLEERLLASGVTLAGLVALGMFFNKLSDSKYLLSELNKYLGDLDWQRY